MQALRQIGPNLYETFFFGKKRRSTLEIDSKNFINLLKLVLAIFKHLLIH